jgi:DNA polymerase III subunit epsilon
MMSHTAEDLLAALLSAVPRRTSQAPRESRGLYGLIDHEGELRYIGSTSSSAETLYKRIHQRHRTGSENTSHYFSRMYNSGRMWRDRNDPGTKADGDIAKALRNAFVADHCRAVWVPLPDDLDIARLEAEVLRIAPHQVVAWNRRGMDPYGEPVDLVDATIRRLGLGQEELAAIERQRLRFLAGAEPTARAPVSLSTARIAPFPTGPFRFVALDVETANNDRGSICQIGVACVRSDNSIETWVTFVDPQTNLWIWSGLHGITARTVRGAPTFKDVLPLLERALEGTIVYQHSGFDRAAIAAASARAGVPAPDWQWRDSVQVARAAWPALKGRGGHGHSSLKAHLGLQFNHHDAGEDARAAAEVVLHAEAARQGRAEHRLSRPEKLPVDAEDFDVIEDFIGESSVTLPMAVSVAAVAVTTSQPTSMDRACRHIGITQITKGNIDNHHIYLRGFFESFPADAVGGSNKAEAAVREISVDWGGETVVMTDLDGTKKFFRKRSWIRSFFERNGIMAGDLVSVDETAPFSYRVSLVRGPRPSA